MVKSFEALRLPAFPEAMLCPHCLRYVEVPAGWKHLGVCAVCYLDGHSTGDPMACEACLALGWRPEANEKSPVAS